MKRVLLNSVILVCVAWTARASAQAGFADPAKTSASDRKFIRATAENSWIEQQIGHLAQQRSQNDRLKAMGRKMESDYSQLIEELTNMPAAGLVQPISSAKSSRVVDRLSHLSGKEFDQNALRELDRYNQQTIRQCDHESMHGESSVIKQFALAALPILQSDLDQGQTLYAQLNNKAREPSEAVEPGVSPGQNNQSSP